jgi:magnesium-protoporphyrin IX monomethyl ester (oxidative) cyclase
VFTKTSEISKQVFPITLDIDHPRWQKGLKQLQRPMSIWTGRKKSGIVLRPGRAGPARPWAFARPLYHPGQAP